MLNPKPYVLTRMMHQPTPRGGSATATPDTRRRPGRDERANDDDDDDDDGDVDGDGGREARATDEGMARTTTTGGRNARRGFG